MKGRKITVPNAEQTAAAEVEMAGARYNSARGKVAKAKARWVAATKRADHAAEWDVYTAAKAEAEVKWRAYSAAAVVADAAWKTYQTAWKAYQSACAEAMPTATSPCAINSKTTHCPPLYFLVEASNHSLNFDCTTNCSLRIQPFESIANTSHGPRHVGWLATTNDGWQEYSHGGFGTLAEAVEAAETLAASWEWPLRELAEWEENPHPEAVWFRYIASDI